MLLRWTVILCIILICAQITIQTPVQPEMQMYSNEEIEKTTTIATSTTEQAEGPDDNIDEKQQRKNKKQAVSTEESTEQEEIQFTNGSTTTTTEETTTTTTEETTAKKQLKHARRNNRRKKDGRNGGHQHKNKKQKGDGNTLQGEDRDGGKKNKTGVNEVQITNSTKFPIKMPQPSTISPPVEGSYNWAVTDLLIMPIHKAEQPTTGGDAGEIDIASSSAATKDTTDPEDTSESEESESTTGSPTTTTTEETTTMKKSKHKTHRNNRRKKHGKTGGHIYKNKNQNKDGKVQVKSHDGDGNSKSKHDKQDKKDGATGSENVAPHSAVTEDRMEPADTTDYKDTSESEESESTTGSPTTTTTEETAARRKSKHKTHKHNYDKQDKKDGITGSENVAPHSAVTEDTSESEGSESTIGSTGMRTGHWNYGDEGTKLNYLIVISLVLIPVLIFHHCYRYQKAIMGWCGYSKKDALETNQGIYSIRLVMAKTG